MEMEKIPSFQLDHIRLKRGIYVSRKDYIGGEVVTTFDIRMKEPNREPVLGAPELHTIEHLAATYLRNHPLYKDRIVFWGPMGCLTGNYFLMRGDFTYPKIYCPSCRRLSASSETSKEKCRVRSRATVATACCTTCRWPNMRPRNTCVRYSM